MKAHVIRGQIVNFVDQQTLSHIRHGAIVISQDGKIDWLGEFLKLPKKYSELNIKNFGEKLLLPGFVDTHIHFPQYRILAAPGKDLLDWLNRFTFAEEAQYSDIIHAQNAARLFIALLLQNGTTSASVFCSSHVESATALFSTAEKFGMALTAGKVMMDCNAPQDVCDETSQSGKDTQELIDDWHGKGRLRYAITPRFALTSTPAQLEIAGQLLKSNPGLVMQTHLSENTDEIAMAKEQFPEATDYTDIYDRFGLLGPTSLFGHGIHLSDRERSVLADSGSKVVHCPTSNTFLGSGLFDLAATKKAGIDVGIATDIGGGTSYSMLATMAEGYRVAMLKGYRPTVAELYHMATLGNAELLGLGNEIGSLEVGKWADITVLDPLATHSLRFRNDLSETIEDVLFSLMVLGDDRAVDATFVAGAPLWLKPVPKS